MHNSM